MGLVLLAGGLLGSSLGVAIFTRLRTLGQFDLFVSLLYVILLGTIGSLMLVESARTLRRRNDPNAVLVPRRRHTWAHGLPLKMRFRASNLYVSAIPPFVVGFLVGILGATMGVGGGFIMVPAMIYIIGMPTKVVVGTSVFQFLFVTAFTAVMHAVQSATVDVMLAVILLVGGVIGAQIGVGLAARLRAEQLRILLALLVVGVSLKLFADLVIKPEELFSHRSLLTVLRLAALLVVADRRAARGPGDRGHRRLHRQHRPQRHLQRLGAVRLRRHPPRRAAAAGRRSDRHHHHHQGPAAHGEGAGEGPPLRHLDERRDRPGPPGAELLRHRHHPAARRRC